MFAFSPNDFIGEQDDHGLFKEKGCLQESLPSSRTRIKGIFRAGFVKEGEMFFDGENFIRYRLKKTEPCNFMLELNKIIQFEIILTILIMSDFKISFL